MVWDPNKKLVQDVAAPLSRDAFIDPTTGAERPINNAVTNPTNYAADVKTGQNNAVINKQIDQIAHDVNLAPEVKAAKMKELFNTKTAPVGIAPEVRQQIVDQRDLPQNQYTPPTVERQMEAEARNAKKFGLDLNNPADVAAGYETTYQPEQISNLLKSGQIDASVFSADKLKSYGLTPERIQELANAETDPSRKQRLLGLYQQVLQTGQMGGQVESTLNATPKPTNQMMGILSEALNAKNNFKNQKLGTSDLFQQAGLSGYAVLAQSLNQRSAEMQDKAASAQAMVAESGGAMASTYKAIADNYQKVMDQYNEQTKMLLDLDKEARQNEQAMSLLDKQQSLEKEMYEWKKGVDDQYATDKTTPKYDEDGNFLGYYDTETKSFVPSEGSSGGPGEIPKTEWGSIASTVKNIFYQPGKSDYPSGKGGKDGTRECGEATNDITNGPRAGDTYASKMAGVTKQTNPQVGNNLVLPLTFGGGKVTNGHIETVTLVDPSTDTIQTQSWNRDGKGTQTTQTYKISDLKAKYKDNWGFTDSTLKPEYAKKLAAATQPKAPSGIANAAKTGMQAFGPIGAVAGAVAGATKEILPKQSPVDQLYAAASTAAQKLEARDPKSAMRKRFDALPPDQQKQYINDLIAIQQKKDLQYEGA